MTRELRDNIEIQYDTIAGLLNVMGEEGRLIRLRKSEQKVLWSLGEDGNRKRIKCQEKPPKTGSRFQTGSHFSPICARDGNRFSFPQAPRKSGTPRRTQ